MMWVNIVNNFNLHYFKNVKSDFEIPISLAGRKKDISFI